MIFYFFFTEEKVYSSALNNEKFMMIDYLFFTYNCILISMFLYYHQWNFQLVQLNKIK